MRVQIITFGGIITTIEVPDKNGEIQDVALGFKTLKDYEESSPYFGALIGRFGNRIANGKFNLDGKQYSLVQNNGENHLHGGTKGFDKVVWTAEPQVINDLAQLKLSYVSKDMEEGYPGNLNVEVLYTLTTENTLEVEYKASTDKKTIINLTQHTYFNLSGDIDILDHELMLNADAYLPVDKNLIPLGKLESVDDTPFNFKTSKIIGRDIENQHEQLKRGMGYDHCWVLNEANTGLRSAAVLYHPVSGRQMEVLTDQPGIQFYSGNFLDGTLSMKNSESFYGPRSGLCLETQHFPDSPNQPNFPSVVLNPREDFYSKTVFKFSNK
jgi:aldose 1-epimerase